MDMASNRVVARRLCLDGDTAADFNRGALSDACAHGHTFTVADRHHRADLDLARTHRDANGSPLRRDRDHPLRQQRK